MGVNLSIKDVPEALAQSLRERAARNHRSLQGELMSIIEQAARAAPSSRRWHPRASGVDKRARRSFGQGRAHIGT